MTVKRLTTRGRATAEAIANREEFTTSGALSAKRVMGYASSGRLSGTDLDAFKADQGNLSYVVYSYATPIAWVTFDSKVYKVAQKFSVTTSKHQGNLYLL